MASTLSKASIALVGSLTVTALLAAPAVANPGTTQTAASSASQSQQEMAHVDSLKGFRSTQVTVRNETLQPIEVRAGTGSTEGAWRTENGYSWIKPGAAKVNIGNDSTNVDLRGDIRTSRHGVLPFVADNPTIGWPQIGSPSSNMYWYVGDTETVNHNGQTITMERLADDSGGSYTINFELRVR